VAVMMVVMVVVMTPVMAVMVVMVTNLNRHLGKPRSFVGRRPGELCIVSFQLR
jgi:heme/copper-type cytochrome/quinol oxidase subunit 2